MDWLQSIFEVVEENLRPSRVDGGMIGPEIGVELKTLSSAPLGTLIPQLLS